MTKLRLCAGRTAPERSRTRQAVHSLENLRQRWKIFEGPVRIRVVGPRDNLPAEFEPLLAASQDGVIDGGVLRDLCGKRSEEEGGSCCASNDALLQEDLFLSDDSLSEKVRYSGNDKKSSARMDASEYDNVGLRKENLTNSFSLLSCPQELQASPGARLREVVRRIATKERPAGEFSKLSDIDSDAFKLRRQDLNKEWREVQIVPEDSYVSIKSYESPILPSEKVKKHESMYKECGMAKEKRQEARNSLREKCENFREFRRENKWLPNVDHQLITCQQTHLNPLDTCEWVSCHNKQMCVRSKTSFKGTELHMKRLFRYLITFIIILGYVIFRPMLTDDDVGYLKLQNSYNMLLSAGYVFKNYGSLYETDFGIFLH